MTVVVTTRTFTDTDFDKAVQSYFDGAQDIINQRYVNSILTASVLTMHKGRRYIKFIVTTDGGKGQRSVWAFIDRTNGDILKPATWNAPAKHARGNVFDSDFGLQHTSWTGPNYLK